jgi:hypothetical protein
MINKASEVIGLAGVALVDCRVEISTSLAAGSYNVSIGSSLRHVSHYLKGLNQAVTIGNTRERPAENFFFHSE